VALEVLAQEVVLQEDQVDQGVMEGEMVLLEIVDRRQDQMEGDREVGEAAEILLTENQI
jgi:hypothetical protein